jgi:GT2 family glycosyltransferase
MNLTEEPAAGVVVIGRNEGERLVSCLRSLENWPGPVVYVDSASEDDSVAKARELGAVVVELTRDRQLSAARGRNAGAAYLRQHWPTVRYVQFVDGDCVVDANWPHDATAFLDQHATVAIVCGRLRERHRDASIYNRLCDLEWDRPVGRTQTCGGIFMVRAQAFHDVGEFNETITAGEEPELCRRLTAAGWNIHRLSAEMGTHDADMHRFGQWWRRAVRSGHAYAEAAWRHGRGPERFGVRPSVSIWWWAFGWPMLLIALAWPTAGWAFLGLAAYPLLWLRILGSQRRRGRTLSDAALYATFCILGKWAQWQGQLTFLKRKLTGTKASIIEYKGPAADASGLIGDA